MNWLELAVHSIKREALRVISCDLRPAAQQLLPAFEAGAHIDLILPNGLSRSYSLVNPQGERFRYVIAVALDERSRGGSEFIHRSSSPGQILRARYPRNNFTLSEAAGHSIFIAGGIGITPILCMAHRLTELRRTWNLLYCARTRGQASMLNEIATIVGRTRTLDLRFSEEAGYRVPDLATLISSASPQTHFYCCGPQSLMEAFVEATRHIPTQRIHRESFTAVDVSSPELGGFDVRLSRSGMTLRVPEGQTILAALRAAGFNPPCSLRRRNMRFL
jgi:vanillate O-demethylase ferredoxin subunit